MSNSIETTVVGALNNNYVFAVLALIAYAYGQRAAPRLPDWLMRFFSSDIVRILFLSLLLIFRFETRPTVAFIIALAFIFISQYVYIDMTREQFECEYKKIVAEKKKKNKVCNYYANINNTNNSDIVNNIDNYDNYDENEYNDYNEIRNNITGCKKSASVPKELFTSTGCNSCVARNYLLY